MACSGKFRLKTSVRRRAVEAPPSKAAPVPRSKPTALKKESASSRRPPCLSGQSLRHRRSRLEILEKIGSGSYGDVYAGKYHKKMVAIKVELKKTDQLTDEYRLYLKLRDVCSQPGSGHRSSLFLQVHGLFQFSMDGRMLNAMVFDRAGHSLESLVDKSGPFPHGLDDISVVHLALKMLRSLRVVHSCGYIHRDITPRNILIHPRTGEESSASISSLMDEKESSAEASMADMSAAIKDSTEDAMGCALLREGDSKKSARAKKRLRELEALRRRMNFWRTQFRSGKDKVYLIDLGLAKPMVDLSTVDLRKEVSKPLRNSVVGTPRYCSRRAHRGQVMCQRDDLLSLVYVCVFVRNASLPWASVYKDRDRNRRIGAHKYSLTMAKLCADMAPGFVMFAEGVNGLRLGEVPPYDLYEKALRSDLRMLTDSQPELVDASNGCRCIWNRESSYFIPIIDYKRKDDSSLSASPKKAPRKAAGISAEPMDDGLQLSPVTKKRRFCR